MRMPNDCSVQWVVWNEDVGFYYAGSHFSRSEAISKMVSDFGREWRWMKKNWGVKVVQVRFVPVLAWGEGREW